MDEAAAGLDALSWSWRRRGRIATRLWWQAARLGLTTYPLYRDRIKSWDVWRAVHHCRATLAAGDPVYDVGAWQSEVSWALRQAGFSRLAGCDTDPRVVRMPGARPIRYVAADFFDVDLAPASLGAITCLSVIEHGVDVEAFLERCARALRRDGRMLITTDYWPEPVGTDGLDAFGRSWHVFSRSDAEALIATASRHGLEPDGPVSLEARDAPIAWNNRHYTFLWLAFRNTR